MAEWIISSVVLILAICVIRTILKGKIGLRLQYALWGIVLLRLLIPVNFFESSMSIMNVTNHSQVVEEVQEIFIKVPTKSENNQPIQTPVTHQSQVNQEVSQNKTETVTQTTTPAFSEKESTQFVKQISLMEIAFSVWVLGMTIVGTVLVFTNVHFFLRLFRSRKRLTVAKSPLRIYVTNAVETPCLFGLFRPAIYLTPAVASDKATMQHVLAHELTHFRHLDFVWTTLRSVCLVLHWYNPFVWIAAKLSRQDSELACDEGVLKRIGEEQRANYGRTLIDLTCRQRFGNILIGATTMTGGKKAIKERITLLMKRPKTAVFTAILLLMIGTMLVGCTFSGDKKIEKDKQDIETRTSQDDKSDTSTTDNQYDWTEKTAQSAEEFVEIISKSVYAQTPGKTHSVYFDDLTFTAYLEEVNGFRYQVWYKDELILGPESLTDDSWDLLEGGNTKCYVMTYNNVPTFVFMTVEAGVGDAYHSDVKIFDANGTVLFNEDFRGEATFDPESLELSFVKSVPNPDPDPNDPFDRELWEHHIYSFMYNIDGGPMTYMTMDPSQGLEGIDMDTYLDLVGLFCSNNREISRGYSQALTSYYDSPEDVDLYEYFYNGAIDGTFHNNDITSEELSYLEDGWGEIELDICRATEEQMNEALQKYFGISLEETNKKRLTGFVYYEPTKAYFTEYGDTNAAIASFYGATKLANGDVELYYNNESGWGNGVVTLHNQDGSWKVVSNHPVEG